VSSSNGYYSESLIAREIRETKEKEEELKRQRKKCGLAEDINALITQANNDANKSSSSTAALPPPKNSSFLSNLDFFTSKANHVSNDTPLTSASPRRSTITLQHIGHDTYGGGASVSSSRQSSHDELKQINNVVSQELNRFNDNGVPIKRTNSTSNLIQRSSSNHNMFSPQTTSTTTTTSNIIQREIEAIRAKEAELRQLGRIQHTSDEHSDPKKYQELVSALPKSHSVNAFSAGKVRRDSERSNGPLAATSNGFLKPKTMTNHGARKCPLELCVLCPSSSSLLLATSSIRGKFPSPNPAAPIVSSSTKATDYGKLSSTDRLQLEKRECQEREQELK
jgi:hypothetical protein